MKLISNWRMLWRFWTVRLQAVCAGIASLLFFDPAALLFALNMIPGYTRAILPPGAQLVLQIVGGLVFALNVATIVARGIKQEKLP